MKRPFRWTVVVLLSMSLQPLGCRKAAPEVEEPKAAEVEHPDGDAPARVKLTEDAAKRLEIKTETVREAGLKGAQRWVIPYDAILYDTEGATWTYTSPEPLTYVRYPVTVDQIVGEQAFLSAAPPPGTAVVTVGSAELYGSEIEFEEE
jgi:hypothetical protein